MDSRKPLYFSTMVYSLRLMIEDGACVSSLVHIQARIDRARQLLSTIIFVSLKTLFIKTVQHIMYKNEVEGQNNKG